MTPNESWNGLLFRIGNDDFLAWTITTLRWEKQQSETNSGCFLTLLGVTWICSKKLVVTEEWVILPFSKVKMEEYKWNLSPNKFLPGHQQLTRKNGNQPYGTMTIVGGSNNSFLVIFHSNVQQTCFGFETSPLVFLWTEGHTNTISKQD